MGEWLFTFVPISSVMVGFHLNRTRYAELDYESQNICFSTNYVLFLFVEVEVETQMLDRTW